jgi:hypothetical protein
MSCGERVILIHQGREDSSPCQASKRLGLREGDGTGRGVGLAQVTLYAFTPSEAEADANSLQVDSGYSDPKSKDAGSIHRLEMPGLSIHWTPVISWMGGFASCRLGFVASLNSDKGRYGQGYGMLLAL